jgi:hypothetical protein
VGVVRLFATDADFGHARRMPIHEAALWAAYLETSYVAEVDGTEIELRIGRRSPALDAVLRAAGETTWCFVTAWNPDSRSLDESVNRERNARLREAIESAGLAFHAGEGRGRDGDWPPEASFLVLGPSRSDAIELGRRFGQLAIVRGELGGVAELVDCRSARAPHS